MVSAKMSFRIAVSVAALAAFCLADNFLFANARIDVVDQFGVLVRSFECFFAPVSAPVVNPLMGLTVLANPSNACEDIQVPKFFHNETVLRFVLINGSSPRACSFHTEAKNAEYANFDLAIIYGKSFWPPDPFPTRVNIPVLFLLSSDGLEVQDNYLYNNKSDDVYFLRVLPISDDINYYITLFSVVIGVCLLVMILFILCLLIKCIQERRRSRRNRLSSRQIRQIPTETFKKGDQYDVCAVCLEDYKEGDKLRILPCSHAYHSRCIDPWLTNNRRNCPLCKRKVRFGDSSSGSDSDSELTSPAEDTPLIGSVPERSQSWGTFDRGSGNNSNSTEPTRVLAHSASPSGHYNVSADIEHSDFDKSGVIASAEGSINSCDAENSIEYFSCNGPQDPQSANGENNHGLVV